MGTNYYAEMDVCPHCKRPGRELHIGKSSAGWEFHFQAYSFNDGSGVNVPFPLMAWAHYKAFLALPDVQIRNEYGERFTLAEFVKIVESTKGQQNHLNYCRVHHSEYAKELWKDDDGYCFGYGEFS